MGKLPKTIPAGWIEEQRKLLRESLPKGVQGRIFYPSSEFYLDYKADPDKGMESMASAIFSFLGIERNGCVIGFYNPNSIPKKAGADPAGFYTKFTDDSGVEKEVILINAKHAKNPLAVGAILAHEAMHLYLFRLNLKLENTQENELLTDLATIETGLGILVLNGMFYSNHWWLSLILLPAGIIYWHSEQQAFGYFKPKQYGSHAMKYFKDLGVSAADVSGYLRPQARYFISRDGFRKSNNTTDFIRGLERAHRKKNLIGGGAAVAVVCLIAGFAIFGPSSSSEAPARDVSVESRVLATTGFKVSNEAELAQLVDSCMTQGVIIPASHGSYKYCKVGQGIELWVQLGRSGQAQSLDTFYEGESNIGLYVDGVRAEDNGSMYGLVSGWVGSATSADSGEGYPLMVDMIDFDRAAASLRPSTTINLRIVVLARELSLYDNEADLEKAHEKDFSSDEIASSTSKKLKLGTEFFVPIGTFNDPATPEAWFTGRIVNFEFVKNPVGTTFLHLFVKTYGGSYDVVSDLGTLKGEPKVGGIVDVSGWLLGKRVE